jgi:hypothetical protein
MESVLCGTADNCHKGVLIYALGLLSKHEDWDPEDVLYYSTIHSHLRDCEICFDYYHGLKGRGALGEFEKPEMNEMFNEVSFGIMKGNGVFLDSLIDMEDLGENAEYFFSVYVDGFFDKRAKLKGLRGVLKEKGFKRRFFRHPASERYVGPNGIEARVVSENLSEYTDEGQYEYIDRIGVVLRGDLNEDLALELDGILDD